jgi:Zn-dependent peptidase ImmA (M78 family)
MSCINPLSQFLDAMHHPVVSINDMMHSRRSIFDAMHYPVSHVMHRSRYPY